LACMGFIIKYDIMFFVPLKAGIFICALCLKRRKLCAFKTAEIEVKRHRGYLSFNLNLFSAVTIKQNQVFRCCLKMSLYHKAILLPAW